MPKELNDELSKVYDDTLGLESDSAPQRDDAYRADDEDELEYSAEQEESEESDEDQFDEDEEEAEDKSEDSDETDEDEGEEEYIEPRLVQAGRRAHLSDEEIVYLAENQPGALEALARQADQLSEAYSQLGRLHRPDSEEKKEETRKATLRKLQLDNMLVENPELASVGKEVQDVFNALLDKVSEMEEKVNGHEQNMGRLEQQRQAENTHRIDAFFDRHTKQIPQLGRTDNLTPEQVQARLYAHRVALGVQQVSDISDEDALRIGLNALRGQYTDQQIKSKIKRDLEKNRRRFTGRGRGRRRSSARRPNVDPAFEAMNKKLDEFDLG